ncbi:protein rough sheath 2-like [Wolffia australiana]
MSRRVVCSELSLSPGGDSGGDACSPRLRNSLPSWMNPPSSTPSVSLSLSPSSSASQSPAVALSKLCAELEEGRQAWAQHRKEAAWRLSRLEQQLETEKAKKRKELFEEVETKIRRLREEETAFIEKLEADYRDQLCSIQREAECKEAKMAESFSGRHAKLARLAQKLGATHTFAMPKQPTQ